MGELGPRQSYSTCGGDGPHNILSLSFVCLILLSGGWALILGSVGELGPTLSLENNSCFLMTDKIRIYSVERYKKFSFGKAKTASLWGKCSVRALAAARIS